MPVMNLRALHVATRRVLMDVSPGGGQWSDAQLTEAVNWACDQLCTRLGLTYIEPTTANGHEDAGTAPQSFGAIPDRTYSTPQQCLDVKTARISSP